MLLSLPTLAAAGLLTFVLASLLGMLARAGPRVSSPRRVRGAPGGTRHRLASGAERVPSRGRSDPEPLCNGPRRGRISSDAGMVCAARRGQRASRMALGVGSRRIPHRRGRGRARVAATRSQARHERGGQRTARADSCSDGRDRPAARVFTAAAASSTSPPTPSSRARRCSNCSCATTPFTTFSRFRPARARGFPSRGRPRSCAVSPTDQIFTR